jgi:hypothetical protein
MLAGFELVKKRGFLSTNDFVKIQSIVEPNKAGIRKLRKVNGLIVDIRDMPREAQEEAFRRGLIPYIPSAVGAN